MPEGWTVTTAASGPAARGSALDVQLVRDGNRGIQPTINVIDLHGDDSRAGRRESLREIAQRNLADLMAHPVRAGLPTRTRVSVGESEDPTRTTVDGDPALRFHLVATFESKRLLLEQIFVSHAGDARSVSLITDSGSSESGEDALAEVLDSWRWRD